MWCILGELGSIEMMPDDISGEGDFRGVIRRLGDQRGRKRQKGGIGVAGGCHADKAKNCR